MNRLARRIAIPILCALLAGAGAASAAPPFGAPPGPPPDDRVFERNADRLGLDAETLAKIRAIVDASRQSGEEYRSQLFEGHAALRDLLEQDEPDQQAVMKQVEELGEIETAARKHRISTLLEIRGLLSPEQRAELRSLRDEHHPRHSHGCRGSQKKDEGGEEQ